MSINNKEQAVRGALDLYRFLKGLEEPEEPEEPEGPTNYRNNPLWGIDVSSHQQGLSMKQVKEEGYSFAVVKATEGPYRDGTKYTNTLYNRHINDAKAAGLVPGAYHFLVETDPKAQVDHFLSVVGDVKGKMIMVDFEAYNPPYEYLSPLNATLEQFIRELRRRIGSHPIILYSGQGYWETNIPSGPFSHYGADYAWDAFYPYHPEVDIGSKLYYRARSEGKGWGKRWGGVEPLIWQFSATGKVAGMNLDVNAFRGSMETLRGLTGSVYVGGDDGDDGDDGAWRPGATGDLVPPGFRPKTPQAHSSNYTAVHPTRYEWNDDIAKIVQSVYREFGGPDKLHVNTYVDHPPPYQRDTTSFDVWGPAGRGDPIDPALGIRVFNFLYSDPNPPNIDWCIWQRKIRKRSNGYAVEPFGTDAFSYHNDHLHFTYVGNAQKLDAEGTPEFPAPAPARYIHDQRPEPISTEGNAMKKSVRRKAKDISPKAAAGGITGIVVASLLTLLQQYTQIEIPEGMGEYIVALVGFIAAYLKQDSVPVTE